MKKIALYCLMLFILFTTTGCKKFSYSIDIDKKDNVTISETEAINISTLQSLPREGNYNSKIEEAQNNLKAEGYTVEVYNDGEYKGLTKTKKVGLAKELKKLPTGFRPLQSSPILIEKAFLKNKYTIKWQYRIDSAGTPSDKLENSDILEQVSQNEENLETTAFNNFSNQNGINSNLVTPLQPVADLTIKIPYRATTHNATKYVKTKKGYEYTWNLTTDNNYINIDLIYEKVDYSGSIAVITLLLLVAGLFIFMLKMKEESSF